MRFWVGVDPLLVLVAKLLDAEIVGIGVSALLVA
jgi:hypothetical protein